MELIIVPGNTLTPLELRCNRGSLSPAIPLNIWTNVRRTTAWILGLNWLFFPYARASHAW